MLYGIPGFLSLAEMPSKSPQNSYIVLVYSFICYYTNRQPDGYATGDHTLPLIKLSYIGSVIVG